MTLVCLVPRLRRRPGERRNARKPYIPDPQLLQKIQMANPYCALNFTGRLEPKDAAFWPSFVRAYVENRLLRASLMRLFLEAESQHCPAKWLQVLTASELDNPYRPMAPGLFVTHVTGMTPVGFSLGLNQVTPDMLDGLARNQYSLLVFEG